MSFQDERRAIENRFASNWTSTAANRIKYENLPFQQPATGAWVRLAIRPAESRQISIEQVPLNRYLGLIVVDIFVKEETGTDAARSLADDAATIFRGKQFSAGNSGTITTRTPRIDAVPMGGSASDETAVFKGWYQLSVSVPYQRDRVE